MELRKLVRYGVPTSTARRINAAEDPIMKHLMRLGLPPTTIRHIYDVRKPYTNIRGTAPRRTVADLRDHHLTQEEASNWYALNYPIETARLAAKDLKEKRTAAMRYKIIKSPGPRAGEDVKKRRQNFLSRLRRETDKKRQKQAEAKANFEETRDVGPPNTNQTGSNQGIYIGGSQNDDEVVFEMESTESTMEEPDDYEIEIAKAEEDLRSKELAEEDTERPAISFSPVNQEKPERLTKRKREAVSPEPSESDLPGDFGRDEKRRKLARGINSSQVSQPRPRNERREEKGGRLSPHDLFCQSSTLAAVFQTVVEDNSIPPELDALDLELLGEEPSDSEGVKVVMAEASDPTSSHEDLRVANAAANLLDIHKGNSNVSELYSVDREALKEAFGESDQV